MVELRGKGWRVVGYLVWMLGAGVVLDSEGIRLGMVLLICGLVMFGGGVWQGWRDRSKGAIGEEP